MNHIDLIYDGVVTSLKHCAALCVHKTVNEFFFEFWWSLEFGYLKTQTIKPNKLWQKVGSMVALVRNYHPLPKLM